MAPQNLNTWEKIFNKYIIKLIYNNTRIIFIFLQFYNKYIDYYICIYHWVIVIINFMPNKYYRWNMKIIYLFLFTLIDQYIFLS